MKEWKPFVESVQIIGNSVFYATVFGVNIIEIRNKQFNVIYSDENVKIWGAFHFSIIYNNAIVFLPKALNYIYVHFLDFKQDFKIELFGNEPECWFPFIQNENLIIMGLKSNRFYMIDQEWNILNIQNDVSYNIWKTIRHNSFEKYQALWNDKTNTIGLIEYETRIIKKINLSDFDIVGCYSMSDEYYILDKKGIIFKCSTDLVNINSYMNFELTKDVRKFIVTSKGILILLKLGIYFLEINNTDCSKIKKVELDGVSSSSDISISRIKDDMFFIVVDVKEPTSELFCFIYDIGTDKIEKIDIKQLYEQYIDRKKLVKITKETEDYALKNFLEDMCS